MTTEQGIQKRIQKKLEVTSEKMNVIKKLVKNTSVLFLAQFISYFLGFLTLTYSARYLGPGNFGIFSFALAITGIFGLITDLGLKTFTVREIARNKTYTAKYIGNFITIKIGLTFLTFILIFLTISLFSYSQITINVVLLILISVILGSFSQLFFSIFQAYEKMEFQGIGLIINSIVIFIGILFTIYLNTGIIGISMAYVLAGLFLLVYCIIICFKKFIAPKFALEFDFWKYSLRQSIPFAITGISLNLYTWIDSIILSLLAGDIIVGWYNAAYRLITVLLFIPYIFSIVVFPMMSKYYISSEKNLKLSFEKLLKFMVLISIPLGILITLNSKPIILLIFGEQYIPATIALQILIWSSVLIFIRSSFERLLEASNRQLSVTKIFVIGVFFNVFINLLVIPKYGYIGAAIVTVLTDILVLLLLIFTTIKIGFNISKNLSSSFLKIVIANLIMGLILIIIPYSNLFLSFTIGILIYICLLFLFKVFDKTEISLVKHIFSKN